jgi:creatinine amidohydrolase/Fe(II)-dependent formamide hydrolase-like protein
MRPWYPFVIEERKRIALEELRTRSGYRWERLSVADLEVLRCSSHQAGEVAMVPVGGVSPHGAHLPTGTDSIVAEAICQEAARRANLLVLPTISVGCGNDAGGVRAGTLTLSIDLFAQLLCQYAGRAAETAVMLAIAPELVHLHRRAPDRRLTAEHGRRFMDISAEKLAKRAVRPPAGVRSHQLRSVVSTFGRRGL